MSTGLLPPPNPAYTPGLQLLGVYSASAGASIDVVSRNQGGLTGPIFQSDFDEYEFELLGIVPGTNASNLLLRMSTNGGVSYDSTANYSWDQWGWRLAASALNGNAADTAILLSFNAASGLSNVVNRNGATGSFKLFNPLSTTVYKQILGQIQEFASATSTPLGVNLQGYYLSTAAVNACQTVMTAGTITGTILVYGKAKSAIVGSVILTGITVQEAYFVTGAMATGTTIVPWDNTIPQNTEGDQYMQLVYTPKSAANRLRIDAIGFFNNSSGVVQIMSLFQDAIASALASQAQYNAVANGIVQVSLTHHMTAGTISPITFKIRCGGHVAGTTTFNGQAGVQYLGGIFVSGITITEYSV